MSKKAALAWLDALGWLVLHGPEIAPGEANAERNDYREVLLASRLKAAIQDLNHQLPDYRAPLLIDAFRRTNSAIFDVPAEKRFMHMHIW